MKSELTSIKTKRKRIDTKIALDKKKAILNTFYKSHSELLCPLEITRCVYSDIHTHDKINI